MRTIPLRFRTPTILAFYLLATPWAFAKPFPAGIVNLCTGQITPKNTLGNLAKRPWANPNVSGMRVKTQWRYAQPNSGTYDWTGLDEALGLANANGKFLGLSVVAGLSTPPWVYDAGATKYVLRDGTNGAMPLPWEDAFLSRWTGFIRAMGVRYDGNPALRYVVISGLGQATETYLAKTSADATALTALGGPSAWVRAAKQIIAAYAEAFPTTPFFMTMAIPFPSTDPRPLHDTALLAEQEVVNWAVATYPGRFGLMTASLNAHSATGYYPNLAIYNYHLAQPAGFQMLASNFQDGGVRNRGTLADCIAAGIQLGGKFVEVYEADVDDPAQQGLLAAEDIALNAVAGP
ncbi:MAG: hypothetical protein DLM52_03890 [Chthoniobacterales bacterium]|nr:MAG: hypothetical protein DLM52_03890 [Chthoniobacterales bacterium]